MNEIVRLRPEIPLDDFLIVFILGGLVVILAAAYIGVFAFVKIKKLKKHYMVFAYMFWGLLSYCLHLLTVLIGSDPFTQKVLIMAMFAYLVFPHFIYFLLNKTHEAYEH